MDGYIHTLFIQSCQRVWIVHMILMLNFQVFYKLSTQPGASALRRTKNEQRAKNRTEAANCVLFVKCTLFTNPCAMMLVMSLCTLEILVVANISLISGFPCSMCTWLFLRSALNCSIISCQSIILHTITGKKQNKMYIRYTWYYNIYNK